jgi:histidinol-phosphate aminotransferase
MSWLTEIARPEIRALRAYEHAVWEPGLTRLHANESPWRAYGDPSLEGLNRYPEPHPHQLTAALAEHYGVAADSVLAGRGSDEAIDLLIRCYCRAGQDAVVVCPPTFGMYTVAARIQGAIVHEVPLRAQSGFRLDAAALQALAAAGVVETHAAGSKAAAGGAEAPGTRTASPLKLIFLCSPNNPTGNRLDSATILSLARTLEGRALVVVDEAYVEFAQDPSLVPRMAGLPGLVILRTLSKAYGLAGARCGVAIAHPEVIALLRKVIQPYAITQLTIEAVFASLQPEARARAAQRITALKQERVRVAAALQGLPGVQRVWPSDANFLLVQFADAGAALERSRAAGLLLRDLRGGGSLGQALRISLGSPEQNDRLLVSLGATP